MVDIWQSLQEEKRPVFIYGTGNGADKLIDRLNELGVEISGVFASDGFVRKRTFRGFNVQSLSDVKANNSYFIALMSFGTSRPEVIKSIKEISKSINLYMPEVPVIGNEIFDLSFAKKHKEKLERVYNLLADEKSKQTFYNMVMFKLTGKLDYLFNAEADEETEFFNLLQLKKGNSFLDLGAYNGDTARQFLSRVGGSCTAVEPDYKTFLKLQKNTEWLNVNAINAAVSDCVGEIAFSAGSGRGSKVGDGQQIKSVTVDSLSENTRFDYINFDVEGAELSALLGAENTIKRDKPKMLISCYHKSEDYFTIPLKVLEFEPKYKVYMRHFPSIPAWDTCFYFI